MVGDFLSLARFFYSFYLRYRITLTLQDRNLQYSCHLAVYKDKKELVKLYFLEFDSKPKVDFKIFLPFKNKSPKVRIFEEFHIVKLQGVVQNILFVVSFILLYLFYTGLHVLYCLAAYL